MPQQSRIGRAAAGFVMIAAIGSVSGVLPTASATSHLATGRPLRLTVELAQRHPSIATTLATRSGITPARRTALLRKVAPTTAQRTAVEQRLRASGFSITGSTPFSVSAAGTPRAAVPTFAADLASAVITSRLPLLSPKPHATKFEPTASNGASIGRVDDAPRPSSSDPVDTIATLQYSGWNDANLTTFAAARHLGDPVTSGQYTQVSVNGQSVTKDNGGSDEVALDQESLLETAPHSNFRAYFVGESTKDTVDAINQIASDAATDHIVAMSDSWGNCEPEVSASALNAINNALALLVENGVTIFSGSGDSGAYDCSQPGFADDRLAVDFPPSSPSVVAVGGTSVDAHNLAAPVQHTWWTPSGKSTPKYLGQGSGGGFSTRIPRPAYQHGVVSGSHRALPDISLDADPASGFVITNRGETEGGNGGTSLAGPLAAATLADTLEVNGDSAGLGNILPALYAAPAAGFQDITVGSNGHYPATAGYDEATGLGAPLWNKLAPSLLPAFSVAVPSVARADAVSVSVAVNDPSTYLEWFAGTGTPPTSCPLSGGSATPPTSVTAAADGTQTIWVAGQTASGCSIAAALTAVDTVAPVAHVTARLTSSSRRLVTVRWSATDASPSTGIGHYAVTLSRGNGTGVFYRRSALTGKSLRFIGSRGVTYLVTVRAVDKAGNVSALATKKVKA